MMTEREERLLNLLKQFECVGCVNIEYECHVCGGLTFKGNGYEKTFENMGGHEKDCELAYFLGEHSVGYKKEDK